MGARAVVENADLGAGAAVGLALFDDEVLIGEGRNLRQVRHAQNLLAAAEGFELLADSFSGAASDANVDFVEDQCAWGGVCLRGFEELSSTATLRASMTRDISPPEAISARGLSGSPGLVAMRHSTLSQPCRGPCGLLLAGGDRDLKLDLHGQGVDLGLGQFGEFGGSGFALGGEGGRRLSCSSAAVFSSSARRVLRISSRSSTSASLLGNVFAKGNDLGDGVPVFALEAVEEGEAVFDLGEALRRGVDAFGVVAQGGGHIADGGAG